MNGSRESLEFKSHQWFGASVRTHKGKVVVSDWMIPQHSPPEPHFILESFDLKSVLLVLEVKRNRFLNEKRWLEKHLVSSSKPVCDLDPPLAAVSRALWSPDPL